MNYQPEIYELIEWFAALPNGEADSVDAIPQRLSMYVEYCYREGLLGRGAMHRPRLSDVGRCALKWRKTDPPLADKPARPQETESGLPGPQNWKSGDSLDSLRNRSVFVS